MAELIEAVVPAETANRLATVFMMLLDGATVEARAFNDSAAAQRAWQAAHALLEQAMHAPVSPAEGAGRPT